MENLQKVTLILLNYIHLTRRKQTWQWYYLVSFRCISGFLMILAYKKSHFLIMHWQIGCFPLFYSKFWKFWSWSLPVKCTFLVHSTGHFLVEMEFLKWWSNFSLRITDLYQFRWCHHCVKSLAMTKMGASSNGTHNYSMEIPKQF